MLSAVAPDLSCYAVGGSTLHSVLGSRYVLSGIMVCSAATRPCPVLTSAMAVPGHGRRLGLARVLVWD